VTSVYLTPIERQALLGHYRRAADPDGRYRVQKLEAAVGAEYREQKLKRKDGIR
jgi:hypothetical protein